MKHMIVSQSHTLSYLVAEWLHVSQQDISALSGNAHTSSILEIQRPSRSGRKDRGDRHEHCDLIPSSAAWMDYPRGLVSSRSERPFQTLVKHRHGKPELTGADSRCCKLDGTCTCEDIWLFPTQISDPTAPQVRPRSICRSSRHDSRRAPSEWQGQLCGSSTTVRGLPTFRQPIVSTFSFSRVCSSQSVGIRTG
ncbi:hypothetical protein VTK73DRAFT_8406 [Phialemonium thermophilum]|uniref:Uncharacterized protein n=1 Tax=Phialemonium thermophilum TaxID=223376 RepID=A0ABR3W950_9PEZI